MKNQYIIILVLFVIVALMIGFNKPIKKIMTRGYQNNNFGNIRLTYDNKGNKTYWQGEIDGKDKVFKTFKTPKDGYRALFMNIHAYFEKLHLNTIEKIIATYAPSNENNTTAYIKTVVNHSGIPANKQLTFADSDSMKKIVAAISYNENGIEPNLTDVENGYKSFIS
jgi:hypothetical protein